MKMKLKIHFNEYLLVSRVAFRLCFHNLCENQQKIIIFDF
jgi:hypothetical protein